MCEKRVLPEEERRKKKKLETAPFLRARGKLGGM